MKRDLKTAERYEKIQAPNGYKFEKNRFLYGFSHDDEYPSFIKIVEQDDEKIIYKRVSFFRFFNGSAAVFVTVYPWLKNGGRCQIINTNPDYSEKVVERFPAGTRYSEKLLFKYCD